MTAKERLALLIKAANDAGSLVILPHSNPDPDAIASALTLQYIFRERLGLDTDIAYQGIIGRAENRALVRYLDHTLQPSTALHLSGPMSVALVDTQPNAGNVILPPESGVAIVIDHHDQDELLDTAVYSDVRPDLGATSTILVEYLQAAALEPTPPLATALFYGIKSNTMGLGRNASPPDAAAYLYLQSRIDVGALAKIEHAQVPASYFKSFNATLRTAQIFDNVVIAYLGPMTYPDLVAEMADLLLRLESAQWAIVIGLYEDILIVSVRTRNQRGAGRLIQAIVGDRGRCGGHGTMAGGQVPLRGQEPEKLADFLSQQALHHLEVAAEAEGQPLI